LGDGAEDHEEDERHGQNREDDQGQRQVGEGQHGKRADEQNDGLDGEQHALADKHAELFDIVGGADHQLAGTIAVMVAEREALDLFEQLVAKIEGQVLTYLLGQEGLCEGEKPARQGKDNDEDHCPVDGPLGTDSTFGQLVDGERQLLNRGGAFRIGQGKDLPGEHAVGYGVKHVLHQLGNDKLCPDADKQGGIGQRCDDLVATQIVHGAAQVFHAAAALARSSRSTGAAARSTEWSSLVHMPLLGQRVRLQRFDYRRLQADGGFAFPLQRVNQFSQQALQQFALFERELRDQLVEEFEMLWCTRADQAPAVSRQTDKEGPQVVRVQLAFDEARFLQGPQVGANRILAQTLAVCQVCRREGGLTIAFCQVEADKDTPLGQRDFFIAHALAQNTVVGSGAHLDQPQDFHPVHMIQAGLGQKLAEADHFIWRLSRVGVIGRVGLAVCRTRTL